MNKEKQYQIFFAIAALFLIIGIVSGYFMFSGPAERAGNDALRGEQEDFPEGLLEGVVSEINFDKEYLSIEAVQPLILEGETIEVTFTENTRFEEIKLKVIDLNEIEPMGREKIEGTKIVPGDEILISAKRDVVATLESGEDLVAREITLITAIEAR